MKKLLAVFFYLFPAIVIAQGGPFAIWENQTTSTYWFVKLDATTGVKTDINPVSGVTAFVSGSNSAFDTDSLHYFFTGLNGTTLRLYTIDAISGNVLYSPVLGGNVVGLHYNCNDFKLYGMQVSGNFYELVSVNHITGSTTVIATLTGFSSYLAESFSFDPLQQHLNMVVFSGSNYYLRSYKISNGLLANNNLFPDNVTAHRYSCADSALFGLWENGGVYKLEKINPTTGTHTTVNTLAGVMPGLLGESACINMIGNFIYRGFDASNNIALISIDATTGTVVNVINTTDNAVGFEEGICCYDIMTTFADHDVSPENILVYPSPFTDRINVSANSSIYITQLYSGSGKKLLETKTDNNKSLLVISLPILSPGIYFLKIIFNDGTVSTKKLVRE